MISFLPSMFSKTNDKIYNRYQLRLLISSNYISTKKSSSFTKMNHNINKIVGHAGTP